MMFEQANSFKIKGIAHGFFTRTGGVSVGPFVSLNCSSKVGDEAGAVNENRRRALNAIGLSEHRLLIPDLVHGDTSLIVDEDNIAQCDALITDLPVALGITYADCLPILLASSDGQIILAIHAGWRGVIAQVINKTIDRVYKRYGQVSLLAAIGPGISQAGFLITGATLELFLQHWPAHVALVSDGFGADLTGIAFKQLESCGVLSIEKVGGYTDLDPKKYFSHRKYSGLTGRNLAIIGKKVT